MACSFSAWVFWNFQGQTEKVTSWISVLPVTLQCKYHHATGFLTEIICDMFTMMVMQVTHDFSISLHTAIATAILMRLELP